MSDIFLTIGICTHNRQDMLCILLMNLKPQMEADVEIILIDDGSTDGTPKLIKEFASSVPQTKTIRLEGEGLSTGRSLVVNNAQGQFIAFLDDDVIPNPAYIKNARSILLMKDTQVDVLGGPAFPAFLGFAGHTLTANETEKLSIISLYKKPLYVGRYPVGANMIVRRTIFDHFTFDPRLGRRGNSLLSNEEIDLMRSVPRKRIMLASCLSVMHCVSEERLSDTWMTKRYFAQGQSGIRIAERQGRIGTVIYIFKILVATAVTSLIPGSKAFLRRAQLQGALKEAFRQTQ